MKDIVIILLVFIVFWIPSQKQPDKKPQKCNCCNCPELREELRQTREKLTVYRSWATDRGFKLDSGEK